MQTLLRVVCLIPLCLALQSIEAHAQLCGNDANGGTGTGLVQGTDCRAVMSGNVQLNHPSNHPGCTGYLSMLLNLDYMSCSGSKTAANPIATNSSAYHSISHSKTCVVDASQSYSASSYFLFNNVQFASGSQTSQINCTGGGGGGCSDCTCKTCTPIVIDLGGRGFRFSNAEDCVLFRLAGTGAQMNWVGWPLTVNNAWLALDRYGDGLISDGSELFGNATPLSAGGTADNGYEALAELDMDGDGWITAHDPAFATLRLWTDGNRNGFSEPSELHALRRFRVEGLATGFIPREYQDDWGNLFALRSRVRFAESPADRESADVIPVATKVP